MIRRGPQADPVAAASAAAAADRRVIDLLGRVPRREEPATDPALPRPEQA